MTTLSIPNTVGTSGKDNVFTVVNATTISYNGTLYAGVTDIAFPDGSHKTCADLIAAAGGLSYTASELKVCVKVEGVDPDANDRQIFSVYSSNSAQTAKNNTSVVPGGMWVEVFGFGGNPGTNPVLAMWQKYFSSIGVDYSTQYSKSWLGFKINYGTSERHSYTMTYVNDFLEESVPSQPTNIDVTFMHDAQLTGRFSPPAPVNGNYYVPIRFFKLYRAAFTSAGSFVYERIPINPISIDYQLNLAIKDLSHPFPNMVYTNYPGQYGPNAIWAYKFLDNVSQDKLQEPLVSLDWDMPPSDLQGLTAWRNGMVAGFKGNQLFLCEPYRPFTFPGKYTKALPVKILGIRADENILVAVTDGEPYIFMGAHPTNVSYERLQGVQAGVKTINRPIWSAKYPNADQPNPCTAMVRTPAGILYATKEGLVRIVGGRAMFVGRDLFTRDEWMTRYGAKLSLMRLCYFDGRLLCYFDNDLTPGFVINITDGDPLMTEYVPSFPQVSDFLLGGNDSLHVVTSADGLTSTISRAGDEAATRIQCEYWTRDVIMDKPENHAVLQLVGTGNVTATVWADGVALPSVVYALPAIAGARNERIQSGFKARRWSVAFVLAAGSTLSEATLAGSLLELRAS